MSPAATNGLCGPLDQPADVAGAIPGAPDTRDVFSRMVEVTKEVTRSTSHAGSLRQKRCRANPRTQGQARLASCGLDGFRWSIRRGRRRAGMAPLERLRRTFARRDPVRRHEAKRSTWSTQSNCPRKGEVFAEASDHLAPPGVLQTQQGSKRAR